MRLPSSLMSLAGPLHARWVTWRNARIADPAFQKWTASVPGLRRIAARKAMRLFDHVAGFVYSQILFACVELGLFDRLANGPRSLGLLAQDTGLAPDAMQRLLDGAAALDLVEKMPDGTYMLGELGAAMVGNPGIAAMVRHHALLYEDLRDPLALLRGEPASTKLKDFWSYAGRAEPQGDAGAYSRLMAASQHMIAGDVLDAYPFGRHARLLDIGGGEGGFVSAAAARYPTLGLGLFDLPPVVERARTKLTETGLARSIDLLPGSFRDDSIPSGFDLVTLVRIVHDHNDDVVIALFRAIHRSLPAAGALLIAEPLADTPGARAMGDAYFGFYLLAMGQGKPRSFNHLKTLLNEAGFRVVRRRSTRRPFLVSLIEARP